MPGSCCFGSATVVASSAEGPLPWAAAAPRAPGRLGVALVDRVGVPLVLRGLVGDLSGAADVVGLRLMDLTDAAELGRVVVAGARTEVMDVVEAGRRSVAVDLVEVTEGGRRVAGDVTAAGTAFSFPLAEAGTALVAVDGVEVVRGRALAGVRGLVAVARGTGGRGVEEVEAREVVEGRDARVGAREGGRRVVDVAVPLELAIVAEVDLEAAVLRRELRLGLGAAPLSVEAAAVLVGRTGGAVDLSDVLDERAESVRGLGAVVGGRDEELEVRGAARGAAEVVVEGEDVDEEAVGSGGAAVEDVEGRPGRELVPVLAPPRAPPALTEAPRAAVVLAPFVRGAAAAVAVGVREVEATLEARDAVVAVVIREAVLVVERRGVRVVVAGLEETAVAGGVGWAGRAGRRFSEGVALMVPFAPMLGRRVLRAAMLPSLGASARRSSTETSISVTRGESIDGGETNRSATYRRKAPSNTKARGRRTLELLGCRSTCAAHT